jgi:oxygen-independent coproporphyrinogen-3 oxidase
VRCEPGRITVTPLGRLLVRRVAMVFDRYLRDDAARPVDTGARAANDGAQSIRIVPRYSRVV